MGVGGSGDRRAGWGEDPRPCLLSTVGLAGTALKAPPTWDCSPKPLGKGFFAHQAPAYPRNREQKSRKIPKKNRSTASGRLGFHPWAVPLRGQATSCSDGPSTLSPLPNHQPLLYPAVH